MKIEGKFPADVVQKVIKFNKSNNGKSAFVDFDIGVKQDDAKKFGEDFATLAFATMRTIEAEAADLDGVDKIGFLVDSIKPGKNVVYEHHEVKIDKFKIKAQPEVLSIKPVDGEPKVNVRVRLEVDTTNTGLLALLEESVGQVVKLQFNPAQGELPLTAREPRTPSLSVVAEEAGAGAH